MFPYCFLLNLRKIKKFKEKDTWMARHYMECFQEEDAMIQSLGFPGGPWVKNSNAGVMGLIPGQVTQTPQAMGQLSPGGTK